MNYDFRCILCKTTSSFLLLLPYSDPIYRCPDSLWEVIVGDCWAGNPTERNTFGDIKVFALLDPLPTAGLDKSNRYSFR